MCSPYIRCPLSYEDAGNTQVRRIWKKKKTKKEMTFAYRYKKNIGNSREDKAYNTIEHIACS
jgi:hypothetical protein